MKTHRARSPTEAFDASWKKFVDALNAAPADPNASAYVAEFLGLARRVLNEDNHRIFRLHFLLRGSRKLICDHLGIQPESFDKDVERIRQELGEAVGKKAMMR